MKLTIATQDKRQIHDITEQVEQQVSGSGVVHVFAQHTTVALTIADLDPGTNQDYLTALETMTPAASWQHPHDPDHFPDHWWSAAIGPGLSLPVQEGKLQLGSWQRLILIELDGPRQRQLVLTMLPI